MSCKHESSLYAFIKNSNDPKAKEHYIKYRTILRKLVQETKKQHYSRVQQNVITIKTTWKI